MERLNVYVTTPELIQFTASLFTSIPGRIILAYYLFVPIVPYDGAKLVAIIVYCNCIVPYIECILNCLTVRLGDPAVHV